MACMDARTAASKRSAAEVGATPLVVCLTNEVAANFTANCLLAVGAKPAMVAEPSEAAELVAAADALLVNLGTVTARQAEAMQAAVAAANAHGVPWVLDPVGVQLLAFRRQLAFELLASKPSIIRGNNAEIEVFLGPGLTSMGSDPTSAALLTTGPTDRIVDGDGAVSEVAGGVPMLQAVTATGCAQGGICAAFLGWGQTPREAALSASRLMKRAGEEAWKRAKTPGSFQLALVDALWELSHD